VGSDLSRFDRVSILKDTHDPMVTATRTVLAAMGYSQRKDAA
jgi:fructose-bisphosphate aldolase class II